jgi:MoxR-like ATPase
LEINENHIKHVAETVEKIEKEIAKQMVGQKELIRQVLICILAGGNALLEGVPGLGKTRLVNTLGRVMGLEFSRIQFTPDLMPADVVGTNIITKDNPEGGMFKFQPGPIFSNIVLADEINRATPKTQSALLEAMQEHTVTVGGKTYELPEPFFVLATQNPIEMEGTYPLPEAQMDRFMFKLNVNYPSLEEMKRIMNLTTGQEEEMPRKVAGGEDIMRMRATAKVVPIAEPVMEYALRLVMATHPDSEFAPDTVKKYVRYGASPRGAQAIINSSRLLALLEGRYNVSFDDINTLAYPSLRHRLFPNFEAESDGITTDHIISNIIEFLMEAK